jgi:hypothetical protein
MTKFASFRSVLPLDDILFAARGNEHVLLMGYLSTLYQLSSLCSFERQRGDTIKTKQTRERKEKQKGAKERQKQRGTNGWKR